MSALLLPVLVPLVPVLLGALAPLITAGVKKAAAQFGAKLPKPVIPILNVILGALLAGLGGIEGLGDGGAVAGVIGAKVGQTVRDQIKVTRGG